MDEDDLFQPLCDWDWTYPWPYDEHIHKHPHALLDRARHWYGRRPCCDFCLAWTEHITDRSTLVQDLLYFHPSFFDFLCHRYNRIHFHYRNGYVDGPDRYPLSREVEHLSQTVWNFYLDHLDYWELQRMAEVLRDMAIDIQIGPRRLPYYATPKPRYGGWPQLEYSPLVAHYLPFPLE
ncbi:hypothetical protein CC78DRAFT_579120 [Lojkania enalia]|uniref:Uncharacterized protein n=1 Tax=Lojkania enalia TaxID=147567 RepID=A0A9P4KD52_9PLEO|nr:hypothetical protein CC78DRAFT_579120 [Didymosphaeria enalia]